MIQQASIALLCGLLFPDVGLAQVTTRTSPISTGAPVTPDPLIAFGPRVNQVRADVDFFTTAWAFGAPYVRDLGRSSLGVTTLDPFLNSNGGTNGAVGFWEETSYFMFNTFDPSNYTRRCRRATLHVQTVFRPFGTIPSPTDPFYVSAHAVTDDPESIDPFLSSGFGSFMDFKNNSVEPVEESVVAITGVGIYEWNVTGLVNEWITNGDANFDYSIAMMGRSTLNPPDTGGSGFFHAFVNSFEGVGLSARLVIEFFNEPTPLITKMD